MFAQDATSIPSGNQPDQNSPSLSQNASVPPTNDPQETANAELLAGMMGGDIDPEVARRVLRKCNGDVQKAATAILEGDRGHKLPDQPTANPGASYVTGSDFQNQSSGYRSSQVTTAGSKQTVIDLTGEDEYNRALHMSLESHPMFGPSDRAPDPNWAMVPSNAESSTGISQDEQSLSRAIEASYNDFANAEELPKFPIEATVREGGRPVALRPQSSSLVYAALLLQSLFFVPQVKASLANLRLPLLQEESTHDDRAIWKIIFVFAHMDLGQLSALIGDEIFVFLEAQPLNGPNDIPGDLSTEFLRKVANLIDYYVVSQHNGGQRLFNFHHGRLEVQNGQVNPVPQASSETCVVSIDTGVNKPGNDLTSRLAADLSTYSEIGSMHEVIFEPSCVVAFQLRPSSPASSSHIQSSFLLPKSIYLDQFLGEKLHVAHQKRMQQRAIHDEIHRLDARRLTLTKNGDKDGLKDLKATIYYLENIADAKGNTERQAAIDQNCAKLKSILMSIETELDAIDKNVAKLKYEEANLFDCPELMEHKYDLRAVLMHTGIPGRKQMYSYVYDKGSWWKTVDMTVTEVSEETVLTDPAGFHLGAGPYMLIYSRSLGDDVLPSVSWPEHIEEELRANNELFLSSIPQDLVSKTASLRPST